MQKHKSTIHKITFPLLLLIGISLVSACSLKAPEDNSILNILLLGVDQRGILVDGGEVGKGGQADTILLLSVNTRTHSVHVIPVSRDSMVEVDRYDINGNFYDRQNMQLCLQYAYGTSHEKSSALMVNKVCELFGNIHISGYITTNLDIIPMVNDSVGGVTVTLEDDFTYFDSEMKKGNTLTLKGEQAVYYLWDRNITNIGNHDRMKRQKVYMKEFLKSLKKALSTNSSLPAQMLNDTQGYVRTNLSTFKLTETALNILSYGPEKIEIKSIPGEVKDAGQHWEYYIDEKGLEEIKQLLK